MHRNIVTACLHEHVDPKLNDTNTLQLQQVPLTQVFQSSLRQEISLHTTTVMESPQYGHSPTRALEPLLLPATDRSQPSKQDR